MMLSLNTLGDCYSNKTLMSDSIEGRDDMDFDTPAITFSRADRTFCLRAVRAGPSLV